MIAFILKVLLERVDDRLFEGLGGRIVFVNEKLGIIRRVASGHVEKGLMQDLGVRIVERGVECGRAVYVNGFVGVGHKQGLNRLGQIALLGRGVARVSLTVE